MTDTIRRVTLPEIKVPGKPLGRHVYHDDASCSFPAETASQLVSVDHASVGLPLDQGDVGSCTANALVGVLNTKPNTPAHGPWTEKGALRLYGRETRDEGQPYPPNDPGGSGLAVCKAAKELGMISSYTHAFTIQDALLALVKQPVITGVNWYDSFDTPDKNGLVVISPNATVRGGHEFMVGTMVVPVGATVDDLDDIMLEPTNSWGLPYGLRGKFRMTAATWLTLLNQQGDCTVPTV